MGNFCAKPQFQFPPEMEGEIAWKIRVRKGRSNCYINVLKKDGINNAYMDRHSYYTFFNVPDEAGYTHCKNMSCWLISDELPDTKPLKQAVSDYLLERFSVNQIDFLTSDEIPPRQRGD